MQISDAHLIKACLDGDEKAWNDLVERYARLVYSIPRRYGLAAEDADDVFQSVFTIVFRQLRKLREQQALVAWLIKITHRESLRVARLAKHGELDERIQDTADPPSEQAELWERQHMVREAISEIGAPCRDLLTALFLESPLPSYNEIAARLELSIGSIGPMRARCFKKLESMLTAMGLDY
jgi:RNA polymerase sigma factor (sigma-70 family)